MIGEQWKVTIVSTVNLRNKNCFLEMSAKQVRLVLGVEEGPLGLPVPRGWRTQRQLKFNFIAIKSPKMESPNCHHFSASSLLPLSFLRQPQSKFFGFAAIYSSPLVLLS